MEATGCCWLVSFLKLFSGEGGSSVLGGDTCSCARPDGQKGNTLVIVVLWEVRTQVGDIGVESHSIHPTASTLVLQNCSQRLFVLPVVRFSTGNLSLCLPTIAIRKYSFMSNLTPLDCQFSSSLVVFSPGTSERVYF